MPRITLFVMSRVAMLGGGTMGTALIGGLLFFRREAPTFPERV